MRALVLAVLLASAPPAQERPLPDFNTFAAEVKKHLATDEERQSGYVFNERRVEQKVNAAGRVTDESVKVYEVYPGLPGEDRYRRLIEEDGRSTPPDRLAQQDTRRRTRQRSTRESRRSHQNVRRTRESRRRPVRNTPPRSKTSSASTTSRCCGVNRSRASTRSSPR